MSGMFLAFLLYYGLGLVAMTATLIHEARQNPAVLPPKNLLSIVVCTLLILTMTLAWPAFLIMGALREQKDNRRDLD